MVDNNDKGQLEKELATIASVDVCQQNILLNSNLLKYLNSVKNTQFKVGKMVQKRGLIRMDKVQKIDLLLKNLNP